MYVACKKFQARLKSILEFSQQVEGEKVHNLAGFFGRFYGGYNQLFYERTALNEQLV